MNGSSYAGASAPLADARAGDELNLRSAAARRLRTAENATPVVASDAIFVGTDGDDGMLGTDGDDTLRGREGNDTLEGLAGNDVLEGGTGVDTMSGGAGNDRFVVDDVNDQTIEAADGGYDSVHAANTYTLADHVEGLALLGLRSLNGTGNSLNNDIFGNVAANTLDGAGGSDNLQGGDGADTYVVDHSGDLIREDFDEGVDKVLSSVSYTLSGHVEQLILTGTAALSGTGNILANRITGNAGANRIDGGGNDDTMAGGAGDDTYLVESRNDSVVEGASAGFDTVESRTGKYTLSANVEMLILTGASALEGTGNGLANRIVGNDGANRLDGAAGADTLIGGLGNDTYVIDHQGDLAKELANAGSDTVQASTSLRLGANLENLVLTGAAAINGTGNSAANTIKGNFAANILDGGLGDDLLSGSRGNDTYVVTSAGDRAVELAGEGIDTVRSTISLTLASNLENLVLEGNGNLDGVGNALANSIGGTSGANRLDGGAGVDTLTGRAGNDTYLVDAGDKIVEAAAGGTDNVSASASHVLALNVENLTLTGISAINGTGNALANAITGNTGANKLSGDGGNDSLTGAGGNDVLDGGVGLDTMIGGSGDDIFMIDSLNDSITELNRGGIDTVRTGLSYVLRSNFENLVLTGNAAVNGTGNSAVNRITGNAAANVLDGGLGADTLEGGAGNDYYVVDTQEDSSMGTPSDQVIERGGGGVDTVEASVNYGLDANVEKLVLTGSADLMGYGNDLDNVIVGNAGHDILDGLAGVDVMEGGAGDDQYYVRDAGDRVIERADDGDDYVWATVDYVLDANVESAHLFYAGSRAVDATGNSLDNFLGGSEGANILSGGGGDDTLSGKLGADTLTGGAGIDRFNFSYALDGLADKITDFVVGNEKIVMFDQFVDVGPAGALAESAFHAGAAALDANDRIIYNKATGALYYDADGNGSGAAVLFARVTAGLELTHANFEVAA